MKSIFGKFMIVCIVAVSALMMYQLHVDHHMKAEHALLDQPGAIMVQNGIVAVPEVNYAWPVMPGAVDLHRVGWSCGGVIHLTEVFKKLKMEGYDQQTVVKKILDSDGVSEQTIAKNELVFDVYRRYPDKSLDMITTAAAWNCEHPDGE